VQTLKVDESGNTVTSIVTVPAEIPEELEGRENPEILSPPVVTKTAENAIGAITGLGGNIENCYVTDFGIFTDLPTYYLYAGGISGKPANVKGCGVFYLAIKGNFFNAGGIVGSAGGSRFYNAVGNELPRYYGGNVQGCFARNITIWSENTGGGIAGLASTNAENAVISNCYTQELYLSVGIFTDTNRTEYEKLGYMGGIIGSDGTDNYGHYIANIVSPYEYSLGVFRKSYLEIETVPTAYDTAFYYESILNILNRNTVTPDNPKEIYNGNFIFADGLNSTDTGNLPFPQAIQDLFDKTILPE
jgi:hypothetical protein